MDNLIVEITPGFDVSNEDLETINKYRKLKFKRDVDWDHKVHNYFHDRIFFIAKENNNLKAFGTLRRIHILINEVEFNILGIQAVASIEEGKGFGKSVMQAMVNYAKDNNEVIIGFCTPNNRGFYLKSGLKVKEDGMGNFIFRNEKGQESTDEGDVIYYSQIENEITRAIEENKKVYHLVPHW